MNEFKCDVCEKMLKSQESLNQHKTDKHNTDKSKQDSISSKKSPIKTCVYIMLPIIAIISVYVFVSSQQTGMAPVEQSPVRIPDYPIHWHPKVDIIIKGQKFIIPSNIGLVGNHLPVHTHDETGIIHYEVGSPTKENMRLGYFFEQSWHKIFNKNCIFEYCNGNNGTLRMFVNGKENFQFNDFIPDDGDYIRIEFT